MCGALITSSLILVAAACGGDDASGPELSAAGERGKSLSSSSGCAGCHGTDGQGGVGPTWQGLAGAEVELADENQRVTLPDWIGEEVSHDKRYFNSYLSKHPFKEWGGQ